MAKARVELTLTKEHGCSGNRELETNYSCLQNSQQNTRNQCDTVSTSVKNGFGKLKYQNL